MNYNVGVIAGDGIGPEIVSEARKVLDAIGAKFGHTFTYDEILMFTECRLQMRRSPRQKHVMRF